jgi:dihydroneopterin aldolase
MYSIDVRIFSHIPTTETMSDMDSSINYEQIHNEVIRIMNQEFKLIEECCKALWDNLKLLKPADIWEVQLVKEDVPIKHVGSTKYIIKG